MQAASRRIDSSSRPVDWSPAERSSSRESCRSGFVSFENPCSTPQRRGILGCAKGGDDPSSRQRCSGGVPERPEGVPRGRTVRDPRSVSSSRGTHGSVVCRNAPAVIQDIQRFAGSTLLEGRNLRKKKLVHTCAEAVDDIKFLWKLLEKWQENLPRTSL